MRRALPQQGVMSLEHVGLYVCDTSDMPHNFGTNLLPLCALLAYKSIVKFLLTFSYVQDGQLEGLSVPA